MENGKNIHSGKTAEKKRSNAIKRDLLVLIHDFLTEEGLYDIADAMATHIDPLLTHYKVADNMDLSLIALEYMAYYRIRFQKEPLLCRKLETVGEIKSMPKTPKRYICICTILPTFANTKRIHVLT